MRHAYQTGDEVEYLHYWNCRDTQVRRGIIEDISISFSRVRNENGGIETVANSNLSAILKPGTIVFKNDDQALYSIAYLLKDNKTGEYSIVSKAVAAEDYALAEHYAKGVIAEANKNNTADQTWVSATVENIDIVRHIEKKNDSNTLRAYRAELRRA